jgi:hypothetical protein
VLRQRVCGYLLFATQLAVKGEVDLRALCPLVPDTVTNPERLECLSNIVEAPSRQRDVMRMILCASDHAGLVVGGQPHRLRLVELGILKRRVTKQPVPQLRAESLLGDVDLTADDQLHARGHDARERWFVSSPRRRRRPRFGVIVFRWQSNAKNPTSTLGIVHQGFNLRSPNPSRIRKECPLIGPWNEAVVKKHAIALITCALLERQSDQVTEATLGQRVLVRKEAIVRIEADVWPAFHRLGQQVGTKASHQRRRQRIVEEQPYMAAASGARSLEGGWDSQSVAGTQKRGGVILPPRLVEVDCEEEARLVEQQGVHTSNEGLSFGIASRQVPADDVVGDRQEAAVGAFRTLDSRLLTDASDPFIRASRRVPGSPGLAAFETSRVHVLAATKE